MVFQIPGHHLPKRRIIINNDYVAGTRKHKMNSTVNRPGIEQTWHNDLLGNITPALRG